jgi:hypothetical protein
VQEVWVRKIKSVFVEAFILEVEADLPAIPFYPGGPNDFWEILFQHPCQWSLGPNVHVCIHVEIAGRSLDNPEEGINIGMVFIKTCFIPEINQDEHSACQA